MVIPSMPKKLHLLLVLLCAFAIVMPPPARAAAQGWLDWVSRNMLEFNAVILSGLSDYAPA